MGDVWKSSKEYPGRIKALQPPTPEMVCWTENCLPCVAPHGKKTFICAVFTGIFAVTPLTNVTNFSLDYQLYLNLIFHRKNFSFYTHALTMPTIDMFLLVLATYLKFNGQSGTSWLDFSLVIAGCVNLWYLVWGIGNGVWWMGISAAPIVWGCWSLAHLYANYALDSHPGDADFHWYDPGPWYANPLIWLVVLSFIQSFSHVVEDLPPRVSGTPHWMAKREFFCGRVDDPCELFVRFLRAIFQTIFGAVDEFIASPRLVPLFWGICPTYFVMRKLNLCTSWTSRQRLDDLWRKAQESLEPMDRPSLDCGIDACNAQPYELSFFGRVLEWILDHLLCCICPKPPDQIPDPALDFIGTGGGTFLRKRHRPNMFRLLWQCFSCQQWAFYDKAESWQFDYYSAKINQCH
eukprot:CAMPEP_0174242136 /NCGR_PEP_ID=MMETSP0417-20130205/26558_1 /TAXON_ID=242541 /ORGANISM="Mayorella sp, Strain BSH-02190019" /LENGTH=404 /DNA_ID=CAMNT_0015321495 /DNA_START=117 /DNA_END=1328 /DNA_ORIENTATION=-